MRLENMLDMDHELIKLSKLIDWESLDKEWGELFLSNKVPLHPTSMTKWRNRLGESDSEQLLIETIKTGLKSKTIKPGSLKKVTVDTTVQEKNIAFPTDSKLLNKAREKLVKLADKYGIKLRQNYNRKGP